MGTWQQAHCRRETKEGARGGKLINPCRTQMTNGGPINLPSFLGETSMAMGSNQ
jgi:hypothetical protein